MTRNPSLFDDSSPADGRSGAGSTGSAQGSGRAARASRGTSRGTSLARNHVVKGNAFVDARYDWTTQMHRIIMVMIAQIGQGDDDFGLQRIYVRDLMSLSDTSSNSYYDEAEAAARALLDQKIEVRDADGSYHGYNLMSDTHYPRGRGYIEARFNPHMRPFLLHLKARFTQYRLRQAMLLSSSYAIRFYELCARWADLGHFNLSLEDLRAMLKLEDKYERTVDLRRFVVDVARDELREKADLSFNYTQIKEGRRITGFRFHIVTRPVDPETDAPVTLAGTKSAPEERRKEGGSQGASDGAGEGEHDAFDRYWKGLSASEQAALQAAAAERLQGQPLTAWQREMQLAFQMRQIWEEQEEGRDEPTD